MSRLWALTHLDLIINSVLFILCAVNAAGWSADARRSLPGPTE